MNTFTFVPGNPAARSKRQRMSRLFIGATEIPGIVSVTAHAPEYDLVSIDGPVKHAQIRRVTLEFGPNELVIAKRAPRKERK